MKKCFGSNIGILLMIFGIGIILSLILPMKFLVFILTLVVIYIGFIIFKIC